jgi:GH24 family phage-related lysozyme (muramidase)
MAKKRTIVKGLNVDATNLAGISTKAMASPVETYVAPAQEKSTLSPLSEFVNAITPAVQAAADKRLEEKLKRERRIENFNFEKKQNQVKNEALIFSAQIKNNYDQNKEAYLNAPDETIIDDIDRHKSNYKEKLRESGVDELHIETYDAHMEERKVLFLADLNEARKADVISKEDKQMADAAISIGLQYKDNPEKGAELLLDWFETQAQTYRTIDGKANPKRIGNILLKLADDVKDENPNNIYLKALENLPQPFLDTKENLALASQLRAKRDKFAVKQQRVTNIQQGMQVAVDKGIIPNLMGLKPTKEEKTFALFNTTLTIAGKKVPFRELNAKQKADVFKATGVLPEFVTNTVVNTVNLVESGAEFTKEDNERIRQGFLQYQILKAAGIPTSQYLTTDQERKLEAMDLLLVREAQQGLFKPNEELSEADYTPEVDYTTANYVGASRDIQKLSAIKSLPDIDVKTTKKIKKQLGDLEDLPTFTLLAQQAISDYRYFVAMGVSPDDALERATNVALKNSPVVESAGDREIKYSFTNLHASLPSGIKDPREIITKMNKSLSNNKALQQYIRGIKGIEGEYDIGLTSNPVNPTEVYLTVMQEGKPSVNILSVLDKVKILSDPKVLYNMVAKDLVAAKEAPEENSVESLISFDSDERRERVPKKLGDDTVEYIAGSPEAALNLVKGIGDAIVNATKSEKDFVAEAENAKKFGDDIIEYIKGSPEAAINNIRALFSGDLNVIKPAGASVLDETQVGEFTTSNIPSNQPTGEQVTIEGNTTEEKTANMIATQEGFSNTPYKDGKDRSVGYGFYLPALEADEKALIKDVNNVTKEEGAAVLRLKVQKIGNYLDQEIQGFRNIPEKAQSAIISMGYQLGVTNIPKTWKKFTAAIKEAAQYTEGSVEQAQALAKAKFEMLYNVAEDGTISLNKWATQTKKRAFEMAEAVGEDTKEFADEVSSTIMDYIFPKAEAATLTKGDTFKINEKPSADTVVSIAKDKNPAETAVNLLGISEGSSVGREAIYGMWKNIVGDAKQKGQSIENFVGNNSWCALFVTQVLRDSGIDTSKFIKTRDKYDFARIKTYQTAGKSVYNGLAPEGKPRGNFADAQAGDVLVKEHSPQESKRIGSKGHAGIVVKVEGSKVYFIAGNQNDQVQLSSYDINELPNAITIRRFTSDDNVPSKELPSFLDMKAQASATKFKNFMTSAYNWVTNK